MSCARATCFAPAAVGWWWPGPFGTAASSWGPTPRRAGRGGRHEDHGTDLEPGARWCRARLLLAPRRGLRILAVERRSRLALAPLPDDRELHVGSHGGPRRREHPSH